MSPPTLKLLDEIFSIHRFHASAGIPRQVLRNGFYSICRTDEELSIVCPSALELPSERCDPDWACIQVQGPLSLDSCGILAELSRILAEARVSIFSISTFDTDYILVKSQNAKKAQAALEGAGYPFV